ncbi:MAG: HAMP domain-containing protein [Chloroflexaceae bacterium]|nr:HAMP domain-containing protein [Chloroflexaceae bacterium]
MNGLIRQFQSRIRYKIILPFLLLTILVAMAGFAVAVWVSAGVAQERFNFVVGEAARRTNDAIVQQEIANLDYLRLIVFSGRNVDDAGQVRADSVAATLEAQNADELFKALQPFFTIGVRDNSVRLDRLIAFTPSGSTLVDIERERNVPTQFNATVPYTRNETLFLSNNPGTLVGRVLSATPNQDADKFAALLQLPSHDGQVHMYFATITPVYRDERVVGGMILAIDIDRFLPILARDSQAKIIVIHDTFGRVIYGTEIIDVAAFVPQQTDGYTPLPSGTNVTAIIPPLRVDVLRQLVESNTANDRSALDTIEVNDTSYQLAYTPLVIRGLPIGYIGTGMPRDQVYTAVADVRWPITIIAILLTAGIIIMGTLSAQQITRPLENLVTTAVRVSRGDLSQRSAVHTTDEIGTLAGSFNTMTDYLVNLYQQVYAESGRRRSIMESITDGLVMCHPDGHIEFMNPEARRLLGLRPGVLEPLHYTDLPIEPLPQAQVTGLDISQMENLYLANEHTLRITSNPVHSTNGHYLGKVYVLQDLTAEFEISQAKNNFISTISHELRTPITTLRGTSELLLRGSFGELSKDQNSEISVMYQKLLVMTKLIDNVIIIANIDSGALTIELEVLKLQEAIDDVLWKERRRIQDKGLSLTVNIASDLPTVLADYAHVQTIIKQLLDNAITYTSDGGITIQSRRQGDYVQVDVIDTGNGIDPEMQAHVFERFVRGTGREEGISSQNRGIGLGLAIVKHLVEGQGGQVWVTSKSGVGSTFSFTLQVSDAVDIRDKSDTPLTSAA